MRRDLIAFYVEDQIISIQVQPINWFSRKIRGATVTHMGRVSPPFSLVQNRTDDFGASFAHLRTYLVYFKRKYMRPPRITFATADANVINRSRKRLREKAPHLGIPSPMVSMSHKILGGGNEN